MRTGYHPTLPAILAALVWACGSSSGTGGGSGGTNSPPTGSGEAGSAGIGTAPSSSGGTGSGTAGAQVASGNVGLGGGTVNGSAGGTQNAGGVTGASGKGGAGPGTGAGGKGNKADAGATGTGGKGIGGSKADSGPAQGGDCVMDGTWPTADPSKAGPYKTVTENDVGPPAGEPEDGGVTPKFTMYRPADLTEVEMCHPVITWGNGTGATPNLYGTLLKNFASHGFVVIASNNKNVAKGNPAPMIAGVTWVLEQNDDPSSVLYHRIDTSHIGATGHSQGAMATTQASGDSHITTSIPVEGASAQRNLHGPAMFFCGGQDTTVGCSGAKSALAAVTTLPAMYAELVAVDHGSWMSRGNTLSTADTAFTAWMRVHLLGDTTLQSWFYGADCKLCTDSAWNIDRKNMDQ